MSILTINNIPYNALSGTGLGELLAREGYLEMPCGGHGRCGKCKITARGELSAVSDTEKRFLSGEELSRGVRLACQTTAEGDCSVSVAGESPLQIRVRGEQPAFPLLPIFRAYGCAVDIGTTTLAAALYDVRGRRLAEAGCRNPQAGWGADVISRIEAVLRGEDKDITLVIQKAIDGLLGELAAKAGIGAQEIDGLVITGNTVMLYLLTGTDPEPLSHAPFTVNRRFDENVKAGELGLSVIPPGTEVYLPPCISAFVGADLATALLASDICGKPETRMLVDIGTNGEMALLHEGILYFCSAAAGPAFEGAGLSMGMEGKYGAVDSVRLKGGELDVHVIGEGEAFGICGSGVVDAAACLLETGRMDETGYLEEDPAMLTRYVGLSQEDIRRIQLAKGAIHAGIRTLLHYAGIGTGEVSELLIAGGFGSFLNVANAGRIGLIPEEMTPKVRVIGNGALEGAAMLLLNREYRAACSQYGNGGRVIELSTDSFFGEEYIEKMMF